MAVTINASTLDGGYTPMCSNCGVALCWDISEQEYEDGKGFWDDWTCKDCNPDYKGAYQRWMARQSLKRLKQL
jgi:hypothetical protein